MTNTQTARVTARQVAESLSPQELREAAKDFRKNRGHDNRGLEVIPSTEDIAQLLEYISDLRETDAVCPHCGWDYREASNE